MLALGQTKSDNINQIITKTFDSYLLIYSKWVFEIWSHQAANNNDQW